MDKEEGKVYIKNLVEKHLPELVKWDQEHKEDTLIFHQDSFARDYEKAELLLMGAAIKYIGMTSGKDIFITGKDQELSDKPK